jgi:hypothetical protein
MMTSDEINQANKNFVGNMIKNKNNYNPYYSSGPSTMTDVDTFPYPRYYRGDFSSEYAVIFEREAGWRTQKNKCYANPVVKDEVKYYPNHCFQGAPSTTYPCYPEYLRKYADKDEMGLQLFKTSVNEYR